MAKTKKKESMLNKAGKWVLKHPVKAAAATGLLVFGAVKLCKGDKKGKSDGVLSVTVQKPAPAPVHIECKPVRPERETRAFARDFKEVFVDPDGVKCKGWDYTGEGVYSWVSDEAWKQYLDDRDFYDALQRVTVKDATEAVEEVAKDIETGTL